MSDMSDQTEQTERPTLTDAEISEVADMLATDVIGSPLPAAPVVATIAIAGTLNPWNPTHTPNCRCPSCCKKAKAARDGNSPEQIKQVVTEQAKAAVTKRHIDAAAARYDWEGAPLESAQDHLAALRKEIEQGGRILQQRTDTRYASTVPCAVCKKPIQNGKWMMQKVIRDADTGLQRPVFLCGQVCIARHNQNPGNFPPADEATGLPRPELPLHVQEVQQQQQDREARLKGRGGLLS